MGNTHQPPATTWQPPVSHSEMVTILSKPGQEIIDTLTPDKAHLWHMASCILGEVAELVNGCKSNEDLDYPNIFEECGDIEYYLEGYRQIKGIHRIHVYARKDKHITYILFDLVSAAGTLFDLAKKEIIYNKPPKDQEKFVQAYYEFAQGMEDLYQFFGYTRTSILFENQRKLIGPEGRYREMIYSDQHAQDRRDKLTDNDGYDPER